MACRANDRRIISKRRVADIHYRHRQVSLGGDADHASRYQRHRAADDDHGLVAAAVNNQFREQYIDAVAIYLHQQGLDIVSDGDAHFDSDVGGPELDQLPPRHMGGFDKTRNPPRCLAADARYSLVVPAK
jgi:hypothetical protein